MAESNLTPSPYLASRLPGHSHSGPAASPPPLRPGYSAFSNSYAFGPGHPYMPNSAVDHHHANVPRPPEVSFGYYPARLGALGQLPPLQRGPPPQLPMSDSHINPISSAAPLNVPLHNPLAPGSYVRNFPDQRSNGSGMSLVEPPVLGHAHPFSPLPGYSSISPPPGAGYMPLPSRRPEHSQPAPAAEQLGRLASYPFWPPYPQRRGPHITQGPGGQEQSRQLSSPPLRTSLEGQQQTQQVSEQERRPLPFINPNGRRSDRSVSPRTSNRRSFERYSTDLPPLGDADTEESANRARSRRRLRDRARARQYGLSSDPNIPTPTEMQTLKDQLRHLLPGELPKDTSPCCDICQKDYSAKHCLPTEEDEVAILLPCKHIFGEHCINTWFETCKTHKNKITCPMCRKLLIEPRRRGHFVDAVPPELMAIITQRNGLGPAQQEAFLQLVRGHMDDDDYSD